MAYTYDPIFAKDEGNPALVAQNASITIFDPADPAKAPVAIQDVTGLPLPNPITVNSEGMGPAFQHATLDRVGWFGAGFSNYLTSYEGMRNEAKGAKEAAQASASSAAASAALVGAPADTAIAAAVNGTGTATKTALNANFVRFRDTAGNPITGKLVTIVVDTTLNEISDITVEVL